MNLDELFTPAEEEEVQLSADETGRITTTLAKLVNDSGQQGVSIVALKNHKISKPVLHKLARDGNSHASYVLTELNYRGILEEAKNPDTREEVATEMLARLSVCHVPSIRRRAIHLLLKINSDKFSEVLNDRSVSPNLKNEIYADLVADEEAGLKVMLRILKNPTTPQDVKDKIVSKISRIRKMVEENSSQIIDWNHRLEDLEKRKRIKFHMIEKYHREVTESLEEFKNLPNYVMDLKFDVTWPTKILKIPSAMLNASEAADQPAFSPWPHVITISGLLIMAAGGFWLIPDVSGHGTHRQLGLPPCGFLTMTGFPCPSCGLTTSIALLMHGDMIQSVVTQPFGVIFFVTWTMLAAASFRALINKQSFSVLIESHVFSVGQVIIVVTFFSSWVYKIFSMKWS